MRSLPIPELRQRIAGRKKWIAELEARQQTGPLKPMDRYGLWMMKTQLGHLEWELHIRARDEEFLRSCSIADF
jgi:hypothetical protein